MAFYHLFLSLSVLLASGVLADEPNLGAPQVDGDFDYQTCPTYAPLEESIAKMLAEKSLGPTCIRLAWHSSGTYDVMKSQYGSNGDFMYHTDVQKQGPNLGLGAMVGTLESLYEQAIKDGIKISRADLYTLCGVVAVRAAGGPVVPWFPGRVDLPMQSIEENQLPPAENLPPGEAENDKAPKHPATAEAFHAIFQRMGMTEQETVALLGAHSMGQMNLENSGYSGRWTDKPFDFTNLFFKYLLDGDWKETNNAKEGKIQYEAEINSVVLVMLPSDVSLLYDDRFLPWVKVYAEDEERFFRDFSSAFSKLLHLGVEVQDCPQLPMDQISMQVIELDSTENGKGNGESENKHSVSQNNVDEVPCTNAGVGAAASGMLLAAVAVGITFVM